MTNQTNDNSEDADKESEQAQWHAPLAETLPKPSVYPVVLALGICFLAWGILTSWIVSAAGFLLSVVGCAGWIAELRRDNRVP